MDSQNLPAEAITSQTHSSEVVQALPTGIYGIPLTSTITSCETQKSLTTMPSQNHSFEDAGASTPSLEKLTITNYKTVVRVNHENRCRFCSSTLPLKTKKVAGRKAWLWAACLFLTLPPLFWVPFCKESCLDTDIICPNCTLIVRSQHQECC